MGLRLPRLQHLRRSLLDLTGSKRRRLRAWLDAVSATLDATGTGQTFTVNTSTEELTISSHLHTSGDGPFLLSSATTLPAGLSNTTLYWVGVVTSNTLTLHFTQYDALTGASPVNITDTGTGVHTMTPSTTGQAILEKLRQGNTATQLQEETDIDDLT